MVKGTTPVAYLVCESSQTNKNRTGENYWDAYWKEIFSQLGYTATRYNSLDNLCKNLSACRIIFLGETEVNSCQKELLRSWVEKGGILVGSLTAGLDDLFGIISSELRYESYDTYTIQSLVAMKEQGFAYLPEAAGKSFTLPVISKFKLCNTEEDTTSLAFILEYSSFSVSGRDLSDSGVPGFWQRNVGSGKAFYFPFSIPKTVCILHQGRPVNRDWDGDGYYRTGDGINTVS